VVFEKKVTFELLESSNGKEIGVITLTNGQKTSSHKSTMRIKMMVPSGCPSSTSSSFTKA